MAMSNAHTDASTPAKLNMDKIHESWSPLEDRKGRENENGDANVKVRSLNYGKRPLRGGDWISSGDALATLGVAWEEHRGKKYGLTVAHAFTRYGHTIGDTVSAFMTDDEVYTMPDKPVRIGTVVSIDANTDSLVFEIFESIEIDPLAVALSGGDDQVCRIVLPTPFAVIGASLPYDKRLAMFGAARRGMIGCRVRLPRVEQLDRNLSASFATKSYITDENGQRLIDGGTKLTFMGDCGALYVDEDGKPWCMHTMIYGTPKDSPTVWTSRGALLQNIVDAHPRYFGYLPEIGASGASSTQASPATPSQVYTEIALEKIMSPGPKMPRLCFDYEQDYTCELQPALPISRVRLHFEDDDDETAKTEDSSVEEAKRED